MCTMATKELLGLAPRRKLAGYKQESFAAELGIKRSRLAAWETGRAFPPAGLLPEIAARLACSIDDLYRLPEAAAS